MQNNLITKKANHIRDVIRYLQKFKNAVVVIYIDDKTIDSPLFSTHIQDIALLHEAGLKVVLIPGARKRIDEVLRSSNIEWSFHENTRVTRLEAIPLIKMAAFDVSNVVMTLLAAHNITAIIGNWVRARSKGIINGFDFGNAGEIDKLQVSAITKLLDDGFIPIFPCIGWNSSGHPYNISSSQLAQQVAIALHADKLFFLLENQSIGSEFFKIPSDFSLSENNTVPAMDLCEVQEFLDLNKNSESPVLPFLSLAKDACEKGVTRVHLVDASVNGVLPCEIFSDLGSGTMIYTNNYGKIRPMTQVDIPSVLSVMKPFIESGKLLPRSEQDLAGDMNDYIVYELDGGVHACSALKLYDENKGLKQAEIAGVAVDENFGHMGIGPKMMNYLLNKAKAQNVSSVFILTTQAADWFESLGFVPDSIESLPEERKKVWSLKRNSKLYRLNF